MIRKKIEIITYVCEGCGEEWEEEMKVRKCEICGTDICDECRFTAYSTFEDAEVDTFESEREVYTYMMDTEGKDGGADLCCRCYEQVKKALEEIDSYRNDILKNIVVNSVKKKEPAKKKASPRKKSVSKKA